MHFGLSGDFGHGFDALPGQESISKWLGNSFIIGQQF
jgi:hypothetical protein